MLSHTAPLLGDLTDKLFKFFSTRAYQYSTMYYSTCVCGAKSYQAFQAWLPSQLLVSPFLSQICFVLNNFVWEVVVRVRVRRIPFLSVREFGRQEVVCPRSVCQCVLCVPLSLSPCLSSTSYRHLPRKKKREKKITLRQLQQEEKISVLVQLAISSKEEGREREDLMISGGVTESVCGLCGDHLRRQRREEERGVGGKCGKKRDVACGRKWWSFGPGSHEPHTPSFFPLRNQQQSVYVIHSVLVWLRRSACRTRSKGKRSGGGEKLLVQHLSSLLL